MTTTPLRFREVQITREESAPGTPDWTDAQVHSIPYDQTTFTLPTLGGTTYYARTRTVDVYGTPSAWGSATSHTTAAGPDSVAVTNTAATVTIDDTGITILDGALTIHDQYGSSVLGASGFTGTWAAFLSSGGIYNSDFVQAATTDIAVSEVGGGSGAANYAASLSPDLAYWVVAASDGSLKRVTTITGTSGYAIQSDSTASGQVNRFYQDILVADWRAPTFSFLYSSSMDVGTATINVYRSFRDVGHAITGARTLIHTIVTSAITVMQPVYCYNGVLPSAGVAYARYEIEIVHTTHQSSEYIRIGGVSAPVNPNASRGVFDTLEAVSTLDAAFADIADLDITGTLDMQTGSRLRLVNGWLAGGATTFPASPSSDDQFYRTDLDMWFFYDGTRWLSTAVYQTNIGIGLTNISATDVNVNNTRVKTPSLRGGTNIWVETAEYAFYVAGGTALSGSHKWVVDISSIDTSGTTTVIDTLNVNSGGSDDWRETEQVVDALMGANEFMLRTPATKTGTPGDLYCYAALTYRIVAA